MPASEETENAFDTPRGRLLIREASLSDLPGFKNLRLQALRDHPVAFTADYDLHLTAGEDFWRKYLTFEGDATIHLAVPADSQVLAGMTGIGFGSSPKTRHGAVIWGVYVRPEWRGFRVAERLIETCLRWGKARGVSIVRLGVAKDNEPAIRCYERCGFKVYGIEPQAVYYDGTYYDELLMSRPV